MCKAPVAYFDVIDAGAIVALEIADCALLAKPFDHTVVPRHSKIHLERKCVGPASANRKHPLRNGESVAPARARQRRQFHSHVGGRTGEAVRRKAPAGQRQ